MSHVSLQNVAVAYQKTNILENFNLDIPQGELVSLLGPSGCGKTTTLRLVAGFLQAHQGSIQVGGKDYTTIPVNKRNFGFVFQNYALFPHMSIFDNIAFGLRQRKVSKKDTYTRVMEMLELVGLQHFENRFPKELSGGQKQRVAIARALVINPDLLLFDEPLSNLDANLRVSMRSEIRRIQQESGIAAIYVSHDQEECFSISDRVAIMNKGVIEQLDHPAAIYHRPRTSFVASFIGFKNFLRFDRRSENGQAPIFYKGDNTFAVPYDKETSSMTGVIRPDDIHIKPAGPHVIENQLSGTIKTAIFLGRSYQYEVETAHGSFTANQEMTIPFQAGDQVVLDMPAQKWVLVEESEVPSYAG
ncbi:ABC transporter ATP-binding protein [Sinobaca sp. H24]|uniref:ABC transporter ATP-binding protein n=1 Tax=Sinobaca sp. H24 TaxID=2923376 RepID=UPI002079248D|nr:ABC transporter ATP-binding protein [Sinobaca sp. H24]